MKHLLLVLLLCAGACFGQAWSGILNTCTNARGLSTVQACAIDWTTAGIPGGIPSGSWTQSGSTITAAQSPCNNGSGDCAPTIQTALNACGTDHFVLLGAGTFKLNEQLSIPATCALRGSGANQTILSSNSATGNGAITMGSSTLSTSSDTAISGGATEGSTSIVVASASGITVGSYLLVTELNDPGSGLWSSMFVSVTGDEGFCGWCGVYNYQGLRTIGQIEEVTGVSGKTITVSTPLYRPYSNTLPSWTASAQYGLGSFIKNGTHGYQLSGSSSSPPFNNSSNGYVCTSGTTIPSFPTNGTTSLPDGTGSTACPGWTDIGAHTTTQPRAVSFTATKYAGIENLQIYANNTGAGSSINMTQCAYCWVSGVEDNYTDGDHVDDGIGYHNQIVNNYFSNSFGHTPGTSDADIDLKSFTTGTLVQNNIVERTHVGIMAEWGAAGNVVAYNYVLGNFDSGAPNALLGNGYHGAHPQFNLWEGNIMPAFGADSIWGSNSQHTSFREWLKGTTKICNPMSGRSAVSCTPLGAQGGTGINGWYAVQQARAFTEATFSSGFNLVGGVAGSVTQTNLAPYNDGGTPMPSYWEASWNSTISYDDATYALVLGYWGDGLAGYTYGSTDPLKSLFLHGEYTLPNTTTNWYKSVTHTLPASFYLGASRPSWWASSIPYPAIGPDVTGGLSDANGFAYPIPAEVCYENVMSGTDGTGSPLTFNASSCY